MPEETLLTDEFLRQLINVGEVDILVGLPTHNNSKTIAPVVRAIQAGILKCFPRERAVIINADGGSQDGTPEIVTGASIDDVWSASKVYTLRTLHCISTRYARTAEPGTALRIILAAADLLRARACVLISPEAATIEPEWIQRLAHPVYKDSFDLVSPVYCRQKFEGILMRNLLYPMTRAVYGHRIYEPYASEFAISGRLATDFLNKEIWQEEWGRTGAEMFLTTTAISGQYRVCQAFLGTKTPATHRDSSDIVAAMRRTVGALFWALDKDFLFWSTISGSQPIPTSGDQCETNPDTVRVSRKRLRDMFATGVTHLESVFRAILLPSTLSELQRIAALDVGDFEFSADLWAKTVFEFASAYHKSVINRDHIVQALVPLYRGRSLAFMLENRNGSSQDLEKNVESLCGEFERLKPHLLEIWPNGK